MNFSLSLFTEKELMIMGIVIGSLILIVLVLTLIDVLTRKRQKLKEIDVKIEEFDNFIEPINNNQVKEEIEIKEDIKSDTVEVLEEETSIDPNPTKVEYVEPIIIDDLDDNINYVENESQEIKKEELYKIEEELKNPKSLEDTLTNLEIMEEEDAIISYQELLQTTKELNIVNTDSGDELISIKEILNMYKNDDINNVDLESEMSKTTIEDAYKGDFISSPYLSPILGLESQKELETLSEKNSNTSLAEIQLENTANLEKLDKEMRKTNEFLSILNDLKKNLD